jgi:hypothetical protein
MHSRPSPVKPSGQVQVNEPTLFVQVASGLQRDDPTAHSSTSEQVRPSPA